ncbi:hypothetical protein B0T16DRAFT_388655 [Cercophora newfieldiana]|uniref:Uncharacterized protein n=1 Tax=Cercophora newfieldiana TaxID=92897 RepID=A0AA39Y9B8_9PEZI|nr:hypothetical protein B0T16DRAFT_388655 [Cercophora newfieldiana]
MSSRLRIFWLSGVAFFTLVDLANAQNAEVDEENVPRTVGWTAAPTRRGTITILHTCLATIIACTWTALHLNVPGPGDTTLTKFLRKAKWMFIAILFPEFLFAKAVCELQLALEVLQHLAHVMRFVPTGFTTKYADGSKVALWDVDPGPMILHRLLARSSLEHLKTRSQVDVRRTLENMIGFPKYEQANWEIRKWTIAHSYYASMGGILLGAGQAEDRSDLITYNGVLILNTEQPSVWSGHPLKNLFLTARDLQDKDKADAFVRVLVMVQILWLVVEVAVRRSTNMPTTQLEVGTLSFSVMAVAIYAANWWKPKDMGEPTILYSPYDHAFSVGGRLAPGHTLYRFTNRFLTPRREIERGQRVPTLLERVRNDTVFFKDNDSSLWGLLAAASLVFGSLHCLAWSFAFPTKAELVAWRVSSIIITVLPTVALAVNYMMNFLVTDHSARICRDSIMKDLEGVKRIQDEKSRDVWAMRDTRMVSKRRIKKGLERMDKIDASSPTPRLRQDFDERAKDFVDLLWIIWYYPDPTVDQKPPQDIIKRLRTRISNIKEPNENREFKKLWKLYEGAVWRTGGVTDDMGDYFDEVMVKRISQRLRDKDRFDASIDTLSQILSIALALVYTTARLLLLALMFSSLRSVPDGVYDAIPWTAFLPSIS